VCRIGHSVSNDRLTKSFSGEDAETQPKAVISGPEIAFNRTMRKLAVLNKPLGLCLILISGILGSSLTGCKNDDFNMKWGTFRNSSQSGIASTVTATTQPQKVELCAQGQTDPEPQCKWISGPMSNTDRAIPVALSDIVTPRLQFYYEDDARSFGTFGPDMGADTISEFGFPFQVLAQEGSITRFKTYQHSQFARIWSGMNCRQDAIRTMQFASLQNQRFLGEMHWDFVILPEPGKTNDCVSALTQALNCLLSTSQCGQSTLAANELRHREWIDILSPFYDAGLVDDSKIPNLRLLSARVTYE